MQYGKTKMKKVYLETSFFSFYYDERPESSYRSQVTRDWWEHERHRYDLVTSYVSIEEAGLPVYPNWEKVKALAEQVPVLAEAPDIGGIVKVYLEHQLMPQDDVADALHLAIASYHEVDYLLTWNCRHIANVNKYEHIRAINLRLGLLTPFLITPELLFAEDE